MPALLRPRAAIFLISVAVLLPTVAFLILHIVTPSDGARILPGHAEAWQPQGIELTPIERHPGSLQAGDLLIAVNGERLTSRAETLLRFGPPGPRGDFGQTLVYTVIRAGKTLEIPVTLGSYPLGAILAEAWPNFVVIFVFLLVGLFLYLIRPSEPMASVTLFASAALASTAAWTFGLQVSDLSDGWGFWLHKFCTTVAYYWIWASFVHMVLVFPKPQPILVRHPWLAGVLYGAPVGLVAIDAALSRPASPTPLAWMGGMGNDMFWLALVYVALAGLLAIRRYRARLDPISRLQVRWLLLSFIFVSLAALSLGFLPELFTGAPLIRWDWISLTGLVVPMALVIAVLRYRLFDIDLIINRTLVYIPLTAILAGGYAAAIKLFQVFFVAATGNESDAAIILTTLVLASAFTPVKNGLQSQVDRRFQEPYGPARQLHAFDLQIQGFIEALDPRESVRRLLELSVEASGRRGGAVYMLSDGREVLVHSTPDWSGEESLLVPLEWDNTRVGRLSLGPRRSDLARPALPSEDLETCARRVAHLVHLVGPGPSRTFPSRPSVRRRTP